MQRKRLTIPSAPVYKSALKFKSKVCQYIRVLGRNLTAGSMKARWALLWLAWVATARAQIDVEVEIDNANNVPLNQFESNLEANAAKFNASISNAKIEDMAGANSCPTGHYCPANTTQANACPAGTYQPLTNMHLASNCLPCTTGHQCPNSAMSQATVCSQGYFQNETGKTFCHPCPYGHKCSSTGLIQPEICLATEYQDQTAQSSCKSCLSGHKCSTSGLRNPEPCPAGEYQDLTGQSSCKPCTLGHKCHTTQMTAPAACGSGTYQDATGASQCKPCTTGHKCAGSPIINPTQCELGEYQDEGGQSICKPCPAGSKCYQRAMTSPQLCSQGEYQDEASQSNCKLCLQGTKCSTTGLENPQDCGLGNYQPQTGQSSCITCPAGSYCDLARTVNPTTCEMGTYQPDTGQSLASKCVACAADFYCPIQSMQLSCPSNTFSLERTVSQLGCYCNAGYTCSYRKRITAVVTLNVTLAQWNSDAGGVQTSFKAALASAAAVDVSNVHIINVREHSLSVRRRLLSSTEGSIDIVANVIGAHGIHELEAHISNKGLRAKHHVWSQNHMVNPKK